MKKIELEKKIYNVLKMSEYVANRDVYNPKNTAIEIDDMVLPLKSYGSDKGPGLYYNDGDAYGMIHKPSEEEMENYSKSKIIDLNDSKDISELLQKNKMIKDLQADLMVSGNDANVFCLPITNNDTPEMAALKQAINMKQVDKRNYEDRFVQFQNDMRLLKGNTITLGKMIGICNGFDISCILILKDKENAVNPMNSEITIDLTENRPVRNNIEEL